MSPGGRRAGDLPRGRPGEAALRDDLAIDRTEMANERTLLAVVRTMLGFYLGGVSFLRFFDSLVIDILGVVSLVLGTGVLVRGALLYRRRRQLMTDLRRLREEGT